MSRKVFEGLKILEFAWVAVGPETTRYFADHGATVIRIESHTHFDLLRSTSPYPNNKPSINGSMFYGKYNANKYNASLNLNTPRGRKLAWKFIHWADILIESFRPGTMKKWEMDYETVSKVKPDLIYVSSSMQGQTGPHAGYAGVGSMISAVAGFGEISGWPDRTPSPPYGAYSDYFCQRFNAAAIIAALYYRQKTGRGQWLEQSQLENSVYLMSPIFMDYTVNGRITRRYGNRLNQAAPHGVYPCRGDDRWIAITVFTEEQWQIFTKVTGNLSWTSDDKFSSLSNRKQNEDELDILVAKWTSSHIAEELETSLQAAGIPANMVEKSSDLYSDPQLEHRQYYQKLEHPEIGYPSYPQQTNFILSKTPREIVRRSPCLGEHNEYVYKELLGLTEEEIADYIADNIITTG